VQANIFGARIATSISKEARHRVKAARFQFRSENIFGGHSIS
jgi:hypothetical protein